MSDRERRLEDYEDYLPSELAEWLVDAEDELEMWKSQVEEINRILRDNGYEYPLGARGVADMAHHREVYLDEWRADAGKAHTLRQEVERLKAQDAKCCGNYRD